MIKEALYEHGVQHEMVALDDGDEALRHLEGMGVDPKPDLIILDINLPKRSGLEILVQYRSDLSLASVPVIVLTSSDSPADRCLAEKCKVSEFLQKPMTLEGFLALGATFKAILETS